MITVTCDINVNIKILKTLERNNQIEIHAVAIEGMEKNAKVAKERKQLPIAVINSPFSTFNNCRIAASDNKYKAIQAAIGKHHHGDIVHLEGHIAANRDLFVTEDNDFLSKREMLQQQFGVKIVTAEELVHMIGQPPAPK